MWYVHSSQGHVFCMFFTDTNDDKHSWRILTSIVTRQKGKGNLYNKTIYSIPASLSTILATPNHL